MLGNSVNLEFDRAGVSMVRHVVHDSAHEAGLDGERLDDYVLAVHEAVTNAVRYGCAPREIAIWQDTGNVRCEVTDSGPGISSDTLERESPVARSTIGGRGLWLMRRLARTAIRTGPGGTTVRLSACL